MRAQTEIVGLLLIVILFVVGFSVYLLFAFSSDQNPELLSDQQTYLTMFSPTLAEQTICDTTIRNLAYATLTQSSQRHCSSMSNEEALNKSIKNVINESLLWMFSENNVEFYIKTGGISVRDGGTTSEAGGAAIIYQSCPSENRIRKIPRTHTFTGRSGLSSGQIDFVLAFCLYG